MRQIVEGLLNEQSQHTPGPWTVETDRGTGGGFHYVNAKEAGETIAQVNILSPTSAGRANAQLIAAAPELLRALEEISQHAFDDDTPVEDIVADFERMRTLASEALAKAGVQE